MFVVVRPITVTGGKVLNVGDYVDASGWRNLQHLITQGKLRPVDAPANAAPAVDAPPKRKRGRPRKSEEK